MYESFSRRCHYVSVLEINYFIFVNGISNVHVFVDHVDARLIHHVVLNSEEAHEFIRLDASYIVGIFFHFFG